MTKYKTRTIKKIINILITIGYLENQRKLKKLKNLTTTKKIYNWNKITKIQKNQIKSKKIRQESSSDKEPTDKPKKIVNNE